jgi:AraC family transcriptional regulator
MGKAAYDYGRVPLIRTAEEAAGHDMHPGPPTHVSAAAPAMSGLAIKAGRYVPDCVMPAHADQRSRLSIVIAGRLRESVGGCTEYAGAGSFAIKPGHVIHRNLFGPEGARTLSIELPDGLDATSMDIIDQWRWLHGGPLSLLAIRLWLATRTRAHEGDLVDRVIDLVAAVGELGRPVERRAPPRWLRQVRQHLHDATAAERGSLSTFAVEAGVHPVYLARQFRRHYRCSVSDYAQALRLTSALERMATTPEPLAAIATASGYADQSHLSRACRRSLDMTPRECRRVLAAAHARG